MSSQRTYYAYRWRCNHCGCLTKNGRKPWYPCQRCGAGSGGDVGPFVETVAWVIETKRSLIERLFVEARPSWVTTVDVGMEPAKTDPDLLHVDRKLFNGLCWLEVAVRNEVGARSIKGILDRLESIRNPEGNADG